MMFLFANVAVWLTLPLLYCSVKVLEPLLSVTT